jgi:hypothetical protein
MSTVITRPDYREARNSDGSMCQTALRALRNENWLEKYCDWVEREPVLPPMAIEDLRMILASTPRSYKGRVFGTVLRLADLEDDQAKYFKQACEFAQTIKLGDLEMWYFSEQYRVNLIPIVLAIVHYEFFREQFDFGDHPSEVWIELVDGEFERQYVR